MRTCECYRQFGIGIKTTIHIRLFHRKETKTIRCIRELCPGTVQHKLIQFQRAVTATLRPVFEQCQVPKFHIVRSGYCRILNRRHIHKFHVNGATAMWHRLSPLSRWLFCYEFTGKVTKVGNIFLNLFRLV